MCGRLACCQCSSIYQAATSFYNDDIDKFQKTHWKTQGTGSLKFKASSNIAPSEVSPTLIMEQTDSCQNSQRVLQPMVWGVIPSWHKGTPNSHGLKTNNCRLETILSSRLYSPLLKYGRRCVIICDGFYEWQTTLKQKVKQPYFIYAAQDESVVIEDKHQWENESNWSEKEGWTGPKLLYMAGVFNIWLSPENEEIYSFSVITKDASEGFSWLHHRIPALLSDSYDVDKWLGDFEPREAFEFLKDTNNKPLSWHPVDTVVNNSKNKTFSCHTRINLKPSKKTLLTSWLTCSTKKRKASDDLDTTNLKQSHRKEHDLSSSEEDQK